MTIKNLDFEALNHLMFFYVSVKQTSSIPTSDRAKDVELVRYWSVYFY